MEPEINQEEVKVEQKSSLHKVTPLSKYLALALFVILPFIGGYIGYQYASERVPEMIKEVTNGGVTDNVAVVAVTPFDKADKKFFTNDIFWDVDIVLENENLFWKHDYKDSWESMTIQNPEAVNYVGYGVLSDGVDIYTLGYLQRTEVLDPTKKLVVISEMEQDFILNGDSLFALVSEMSLPVLSEVEGINADELVVVGGGYLKDTDTVFFMGANTWKLESANPANFYVHQPDESNDKFLLGVSAEDVYYDEKLLDGIDFSEMEISNYNSIIQDSDTVWFSSGNCHFGDFSKGELDKIKTYQPPC